MKKDVKDPASALAYITDCNLATVENMAFRKSRPKHEFERQVSIAQYAIDWMKEFGVNISTTTRVLEINERFGSSVLKWAEQYMPEKKGGPA